jgi:hypothetical protein
LARAKRTDRTEARRRHRAQAATESTETDAGQPGPSAAGAPGRVAPSGPPARPGIVASLRAAFTPIDIRGDIRALPVILRHWALLVSIAIAIGSSVLFVSSTNELGASLDLSLSDPFAGKSIGSLSNLSYLVVSLFVAPPPAAGGFLVGFTASRASWLGGLIYGIVASVCYVAILFTPAGNLLHGNNPVDAYVFNAILLGPAGAALFAASAAWYRRFLNLANPNRARQQARASGKPKAKPATARSGGRGR